MTIVVQPDPKPPVRRNASTKRGNGKTVPEKIARIENAKRIRQAELEARAQEARDKIAAEIELRREAAATRKFDLYDAQEKRRAPQFQIDQTPTLAILGSLAAITFIATAILTADGTIGAAASARFAIDWFGYILFGAFEVAILAFMLIYYIQGSRIDHDGNPVKAGKWFVAMIAASALTVLLSAYHVLDVYDYAWTDIDMWFGIGIRLAVAVFFVVLSKGIASVLFAKAVRL